jgi:hypothetical protein
VLLTIAWAGALLGPILAWRLWRGRNRLARAALAPLAVLYGLGVWASLAEPRLLAVRHVAVSSESWRGPPLRIGVVSDTHVDGRHVSARRVARIMMRLSMERSDLVVFLGDYAGGHKAAGARSAGDRAEVQAGLAALGLAQAPLGRIAVLGNHDWWYDGPAVEAGLRRAGVSVLENDAVRVQRRAGVFWVAALADVFAKRGGPSPAIALRNVPAAEPVILLTHWPDPFAQVPARVALTLAGHSHCGQVNLPWIGRPILPSPGSVRWPCGLYREGGRALFVTGGVGESILPVRFRARPEIVIVTLSARP